MMGAAVDRRPHTLYHDPWERPPIARTQRVSNVPHEHSLLPCRLRVRAVCFLQANHYERGSGRRLLGEPRSGNETRYLCPTWATPWKGRSRS